MPPQPSAAKSIFVSHTNDDELAELVLKEIVAAFGEKPAEDGLELVFDRESIGAGVSWRQRIFEWLEYCPAAILLISPDSFLHEKPWVAREAYFLAVRRSVRSNVLIIPVIVGDVKSRLKTEPDFEPAQIDEIKWIECADPHDANERAEVVAQIRAALESRKQSSPSALSGLEKAVADLLSLHRDAHANMAAGLGLAALDANEEAIAVRLIGASEKRVGDAVSAFARYAASRQGASGAVKELCSLLAAREVPDAAARLLCIEMTKSPRDARAVLINSTDEDVTRLYIVRSAGYGNRRWSLLDASIVLDKCGADDMRSALRKLLSAKLLRVKDLIDESAEIKAVRTAESLRQMGRPVVFCVNISNVDDAEPLVEAWRGTIPDCGLLLRQRNGWSDNEPWGAEWICKLEPQLDENQWNRLVGFNGALQVICTQTEEN